MLPGTVNSPECLSRIVFSSPSVVKAVIICDVELCHLKDSEYKLSEVDITADVGFSVLVFVSEMILSINPSCPVAVDKTKLRFMNHLLNRLILSEMPKFCIWSQLGLDTLIISLRQLELFYSNKPCTYFSQVRHKIIFLTVTDIFSIELL